MAIGANESTAMRCTKLFEKKLAKTVLETSLEKREVVKRYVFYKFDTC